MSTKLYCLREKNREKLKFKHNEQTLPQSTIINLIASGWLSSNNQHSVSSWHLVILWSHDLEFLHKCGSSSLSQFGSLALIEGLTDPFLLFSCAVIEIFLSINLIMMTNKIFICLSWLIEIMSMCLYVFWLS